MPTASKDQDAGRIRNWILVLSAAAWALLTVEAHTLHLAHCVGLTRDAMPLTASFAMFVRMNQPGSLPGGWVLMLAAMMSPVLISPIRHIRLGCFVHRRARMTALFALGYAVIWMSTGLPLLLIEVGVQFLKPASYVPAAVIAIVAIIWQCSPMKQHCINGCHSQAPLSAFGVAADSDALRFGLVHGAWCAGSCWAWMLFPMLLPHGHLLAMVAVTVLVWSERLEPSGPARWRWRGVGRAFRILKAQTRIRMRNSDKRDCQTGTA
ncbi:MAG TPA: DUF2182 domain-containing protein [Nitrospira sp.]|nr:DUF2182 domain-containing protein [Nitrospira sp.]